MTLQLFKAVSEDLQDRQPLTQVAVWAIGLLYFHISHSKYFLSIGYFHSGEYGDMLLTAQPDDEHGIARPPSEEEVLEVYQRYFGNL